jgi:toxin ParE1/3/4
MKPLVIQRRALRDMEQARAYYQREAAHMTAALATELDAALLHVQRQPGTGSPRWGLQLGLPGLRAWSLSQFPYVLMYRLKPEKIELLRVLHQTTDIPQYLDKK